MAKNFWRMNAYLIEAAWAPMPSRPTTDEHAWRNGEYTTIVLVSTLQALRLHLNGAFGGSSVFGSWYAIDDGSTWDDRQSFIRAAALPPARNGAFGMFVNFFQIDPGSILNVGYATPHPRFGGIGGILQAEVVRTYVRDKGDCSNSKSNSNPAVAQKNTKDGPWLPCTRIRSLNKTSGFLSDVASRMTH